MVGHDDAGGLEPLDLVCQHVAAGVVGVIGHHQPSGQLPLGQIMDRLQKLGRLKTCPEQHIMFMSRMGLTLLPGAAHMSSTVW